MHALCNKKQSITFTGHLKYALHMRRVRGCIYTEIQPGEILPGLHGSDAPEARGRKAAEKIPASYAVKPLNRPP